MPSLYIPDEYKEGFNSLGTLDHENFAKLIRLLDEAGSAMSSSTLITNVSAKFDEVFKPQIISILEAVTELDEYRSSDDLEVEDIIQQSYAAILDLDAVKSEEDAQQICERLKQLIDVNGSIAVTSKTFDLKTDYEKIFLHSRIISDARPVFGKDCSEKPKGVLINHILKIIYRDIEGNKEIYLSLDMNDIVQMLEQINRAVDKSNSLEKMFRDLGVNCFTENQGEE
jgi:hypothetical protein